MGWGGIWTGRRRYICDGDGNGEVGVATVGEIRKIKME